MKFDGKRINWIMQIISCCRNIDSMLDLATTPLFVKPSALRKI